MSAVGENIGVEVKIRVREIEGAMFPARICAILVGSLNG
jgi:hypothetical protein